MAATRPFAVRLAQARLDELRDRLAHTRWPDELPGVGWSSGTPLAEGKALVEYWRTDYDWREQEARLSELPHHITAIDGADVHFIHARSGEPDALALLLTHGWPGTVAEFLDTVDRLTDPRGHGADPEDAFHVVVASIPGYGFSGPTRDIGWDSRRVARAFAELVERLGYERYGAHGGDRGAIVTREFGLQRPDRVIGAHVLHSFALPTGDPAELERLGANDLAALEIAERWHRERSGYANVQSMRPQTLACALADSPAGQLAWYLDLYAGFGRNAGALDPDHILTNATIHWLTGTAGSAARLYHEDARSRTGGDEERSTVPTGVAVFARADFRTIRPLAERANRIVHRSEFDAGGHIAAMEVPRDPHRRPADVLPRAPRAGRSPHTRLHVPVLRRVGRHRAGRDPGAFTAGEAFDARDFLTSLSPEPLSLGARVTPVRPDPGSAARRREAASCQHGDVTARGPRAESLTRVARRPPQRPMRTSQRAQRSHLVGTAGRRAGRPLARFCFAVAEQSSEEAGPARLVVVHGAGPVGLEADACSLMADVGGWIA